MLNLRNSFIMAPVKTGYSDGKGNVTEKHLQFYDQRSGYMGAVIPEPLYLNAGLRELPTQMGIDSDDKIEGLKKLTGVIHDKGAMAVAHLNHPGRMANPKIPNNYYLCPSPQQCESGGPVPGEMTVEDISEAVSLFTNAAERAEKAGFDAVELQFGHGYLAAQFISPKVNTRNDRYGGSFENRIGFSLEVLDAVRKKISIPIIIRISGDEMIPDGITLDEMKVFARILEEHGAEAVHVSAGTLCSTPPWYFQHMFVPKGKTWELAREIKKSISIPVIFVGQVNTFDDIRRLEKDFGAEYIALGRALVADPDFIGKYTGAVEGNARPCLACAQGCLGGVKGGLGLQCLTNPTVGKSAMAPGKTDNARNIAVVGGGLAGLEAAVTLRKSGHSVTLFEKESLGGQFIYAPLTPNKQSLKRLLTYYKNEVKSLDIKLLQSEASSEDIAGTFDEAVLATGSVPVVPFIDGLNDFYWAEILLEENLPEDKNVLIIGGGLIGVDIATALIPGNNQVTIVKRTTDFGEDMEMIAKTLSLKMMKEKGTAFSDHTHIQKVDGTTVYAEKDGESITFTDVDIIVVSTGMKSYNPLEEELKGKVPLHVAGDARKVGNAQDAISDGFTAALEI